MSNTIEDANSTTGENEEIIIEEEDDLDVITEKFNKLKESHTKVTGANKQLFERTKKAEGFEFKDGKWEKPEAKPKEESKPTEKKPEATESVKIDFGQLAFYNSKSDTIKIESNEDKEFLEKTLEETGKSQEKVLDSKWFQSELKERQEAKKTSDATPKSPKRPSAASKGEAQRWAEKIKAGSAKLSDIPTRKMREEVVNLRITKEGDNSLFRD